MGITRKMCLKVKLSKRIFSIFIFAPFITCAVKYSPPHVRVVLVIHFSQFKSTISIIFVPYCRNTRELPGTHSATILYILSVSFDTATPQRYHCDDTIFSSRATAYPRKSNRDEVFQPRIRLLTKIFSSNCIIEK